MYKKVKNVTIIKKALIRLYISFITKFTFLFINAFLILLH